MGKLTSLKCFNCGESPIYRLDDPNENPCTTPDCEECVDDLNFPHIVEHISDTCPFGLIQHGKTKKEAMYYWKKKNGIERNKTKLSNSLNTIMNMDTERAKFDFKEEITKNITYQMCAEKEKIVKNMISHFLGEDWKTNDIGTAITIKTDPRTKVEVFHYQDEPVLEFYPPTSKLEVDDLRHMFTMQQRYKEIYKL